MDNLYAIYAYEDIFQGLHGMYEVAVVEEKSEKDAEITAQEMALNVIDDYSSIREEFEDNAYCEGLDPNTEEWEEFMNEQYTEDIRYDIFKITKETNESLEELDNKFNNDPEEFLKEYCGINQKIGHI